MSAFRPPTVPLEQTYDADVLERSCNFRCQRTASSRTSILFFCFLPLCDLQWKSSLFSRAPSCFFPRTNPGYTISIHRVLLILRSEIFRGNQSTKTYAALDSRPYSWTPSNSAPCFNQSISEMARSLSTASGLILSTAVFSWSSPLSIQCVIGAV